MTITIHIDTNEDSMWGDSGSDGYDADASVKKYVEMVSAELEAEFPGCEIQEHDGWMRPIVDADDHPISDRDVDVAHQIIGDVFSSFGWLVEDN